MAEQSFAQSFAQNRDSARHPRQQSGESIGRLECRENPELAGEEKGVESSRRYTTTAVNSNHAQRSAWLYVLEEYNNKIDSSRHASPSKGGPMCR